MRFYYTEAHGKTLEGGSQGNTNMRKKVLSIDGQQQISSYTLYFKQNYKDEKGSLHNKRQINLQSGFETNVGMKRKQY